LLGKSITVEQRLINLDTRLDDDSSPESGNGFATARASSKSAAQSGFCSRNTAFGLRFKLRLS
jgi:hypothetical protein